MGGEGGGDRFTTLHALAHALERRGDGPGGEGRGHAERAGERHAGGQQRREGARGLEHRLAGAPPQGERAAPGARLDGDHLEHHHAAIRERAQQQFGARRFRPPPHAFPSGIDGLVGEGGHGYFQLMMSASSPEPPGLPSAP